MAETKQEEKPQCKMWLHLPGIETYHKEKGFEGFIPCESLQWGVGLGVSSPSRRRNRRRNLVKEAEEATKTATEGAEASSSSTTTGETPAAGAEASSGTPAASSTEGSTSTTSEASSPSTPAATSTTTEAAKTGDTPAEPAKEGSSTDGESSTPATEEKPRRQISSPSVSELTLTTKCGLAVPLVFHTTLNRQIFPDVTVYVLNADGTKNSCWRLKEVVISGFSYSQSALQVGESMSLNFTAVEFEMFAKLPAPTAAEDSGKGKEKENDHHAASEGHHEDKAESHTAYYHMQTEKALLDGKEVPSNYVAPPEDEEDNYW